MTVLLLAALALSMAGGWRGSMPADEYCCRGAARLNCSYCLELMAGGVPDDVEDTGRQR